VAVNVRLRLDPVLTSGEERDHLSKTILMMMMALLLGGCAGTTAPVVKSTAGQDVGAPMVPPDSAEGGALVESVRAYLRTFNLDEKTLQAGLTIPWVLVPLRGTSSKFGFARATGKLGPRGHQVYEVTYFDGTGPSGFLSTFHYFIELPPEPSAPTGSVQ
jgi:hypothetical protein